MESKNSKTCFNIQLLKHRLEYLFIYLFIFFFEVGTLISTFVSNRKKVIFLALYIAKLSTIRL